MKKIIITWWAWFIGSNFLNAYVRKFPDIMFINIDALTYAGKLENIEVAEASNYVFEQVDIRDLNALRAVYEKHKPTDCIHFAAESHVDNSIKNPWIFLETNVLGTQNLLALHREFNLKRFHYIWTDEVYGELPLDRPDLLFTEKTPITPHSPYSVSKAWGDQLTHAYHRTYGTDITITRCSNNYGPYHDREKLIPHFIEKLQHDQKVPVYGDGKNVRDRLYVEDHCDAVWEVFTRGTSGEVYNVWGNNEYSNLEITKILLEAFDKDETSIEYVEDRAGHDRRYAIDNTKITTELGRSPKVTFEQWIQKTIQRYKEHPSYL